MGASGECFKNRMSSSLLQFKVFLQEMVPVMFLVYLAGFWDVRIAALLQNSSFNKWTIKGEPSALSRVEKMQLLDRLPYLTLIPDAKIHLFLTVELQLFELIY